MYQIKNLKSCMDLLLITDENKPHYVYIKDFNRFMCNNKKKFCRYCLQRFTSERVLIDHKENCLIINDKQRNKWQIKGKIRKYFNQI